MHTAINQSNADDEDEEDEEEEKTTTATATRTTTTTTTTTARHPSPDGAAQRGVRAQLVGAAAVAVFCFPVFVHLYLSRFTMTGGRGSASP